MIGKINYERGRIYNCEDCHDIGQFKSIEDARAAGWAVGRDRRTCYCPKCAPMRRNVGKAWGGVRKVF